MDRLIVAVNDFARLAPPTAIRRRNGQSLQIKLSESLRRRYETTKRRLFLVTGKNPSQSILMRRSLDMYLQHLNTMNDEQLRTEMQNLLNHR